jgi:hypothetical protein
MNNVKKKHKKYSDPRSSMGTRKMHHKDQEQNLINLDIAGDVAVLQKREVNPIHTIKWKSSSISDPHKESQICFLQTNSFVFHVQKCTTHNSGNMHVIWSRTTKLFEQCWMRKGMLRIDLAGWGREHYGKPEEGFRFILRRVKRIGQLGRDLSTSC